MSQAGAWMGKKYRAVLRPRCTRAVPTRFTRALHSPCLHRPYAPQKKRLQEELQAFGGLGASAVLAAGRTGCGACRWHNWCGYAGAAARLALSRILRETARRLACCQPGNRNICLPGLLLCGDCNLAPVSFDKLLVIVFNREKWIPHFFVLGVFTDCNKASSVNSYGFG